MKASVFILLFASSFTFVSSLGSPDISGCPVLPKRAPPTSVFDLRADDIKVIAALGDSVTAGLAAENINTEYVSPEQFREYRGQSFMIGGDPGAQSIANYLKNYQKDIIGASEGTNAARYCSETFFCLDPLHRSEVDHLNAAQTGSSSQGLSGQLDYILKYIGRGTRLENEWKMINIYIGFNDLSASCLPGMSAQNYGDNVYNVLKRIADSVDKVFINVLTIEHYNQLITIPYDHPGYVKQFMNGINIRNYECVCCSKYSVEGLGEQVDAYNKQLENAVNRINAYLSAGLMGVVLENAGLRYRKNVAVALQPMDITKESVPYDSFSNLDGFHPNLRTHKFASRLLWRQLYLKKEDKLVAQNFNDDLPVYCPAAEDRFQA